MKNLRNCLIFAASFASTAQAATSLSQMNVNRTLGHGARSGSVTRATSSSHQNGLDDVSLHEKESQARGAGGFESGDCTEKSFIDIRSGKTQFECPELETAGNPNRLFSPGRDGRLLFRQRAIRVEPAADETEFEKISFNIWSDFELRGVFTKATGASEYGANVNAWSREEKVVIKSIQHAMPGSVIGRIVIEVQPDEQTFDRAGVMDYNRGFLMTPQERAEAKADGREKTALYSDEVNRRLALLDVARKAYKAQQAKLYAKDLKPFTAYRIDVTVRGDRTATNDELKVIAHQYFFYAGVHPFGTTPAVEYVVHYDPQYVPVTGKIRYTSSLSETEAKLIEKLNWAVPELRLSCSEVPCLVAVNDGFSFGSSKIGYVLSREVEFNGWPLLSYLTNSTQDLWYDKFDLVSRTYENSRIIYNECVTDRTKIQLEECRAKVQTLVVKATRLNCEFRKLKRPLGVSWSVPFWPNQSCDKSLSK